MRLSTLTESVKITLWNQMIVLMTRIFQFKPEKQPRVVRTNQYFDQKTGEQVIELQYRVKLANQLPLVTKSEIQRQNLMNKDSK